MTNDLREKLARAICGADAAAIAGLQDDHFKMADAALSVIEKERALQILVDEGQKCDAIRAEGAGVKVKPLVWENDGFWSSGPNEGWLEEAKTPFGWGYSIEIGRDGNFMADSTFEWSSTGLDTPDQAKAAAQADYERRILSALEPAPVSVGEAACVLLESLRIQPVAEAIEANVGISRFASALRALAEQEG